MKKTLNVIYNNNNNITYDTDGHWPVSQTVQILLTYTAFHGKIVFCDKNRDFAYCVSSKFS